MRPLKSCKGCGVKTPTVIIKVTCPNCGEERDARISSNLLSVDKGKK